MNIRHVSLALLMSLLFAVNGSAHLTWQMDSSKASKKKPDTPSSTPASENASAFKVDGVQPLFLDPDQKSQPVLLQGTFPDDVTIDAADSQDIQIAGEESQAISPTQIRLLITLANVSPNDSGTVFFSLHSAKLGRDVPVNLSYRPMPKPSSTPPPSDYKPPGSEASLCAVPGSAFAVNAIKRTAMVNATSAFCAGKSDPGYPDVKATYLEAKYAQRFVVCNKNPFNYSTTLLVDEEQIQDDDISKFLGFLVPGLNASQAADKAASAAQNKSSARSMTAENRNQESVTFLFHDTVQNRLSDIVRELSDAERDYTIFVSNYVGIKASLEDDSLDCSVRVQQAQQLWTKAYAVYAGSRLRDVSRDITNLRVEIDERIAIAEAGSYKTSDLTKQQLASLTAAEDALKLQNCVVQKASSLIDQNIIKDVIEPLTDILGKNDSFVYSTFLGPYQNPTSAKWELRSKSVKSKNADSTQGLPSSVDLSTDPYQGCFVGDANKPGTPATPTQDNSKKSFLRNEGRFQSVALIAPVSFAVSQQNQKQPQQPSQGNNKNNNNNGGAQKNDQNAPTDNSQYGNLTNSGTLVFGGPRFIMTAGVAPVFLSVYEFQKAVGQALDSNGKPISGQSGVNTIQYSTNSPIRISPMVMGHIRMWSYPRSDKAIWGTVGVTVQNNSAGTAPEYLFGVSQSLWQNWFFLSAGLYIGKQQKLSQGLYVGEAVPSSLTGNIPVENNYKPGFALAVSFRIPKTDAPKTKPSQKPQSNPTSASQSANKK